LRHEGHSCLDDCNVRGSLDDCEVCGGFSICNVRVDLHDCDVHCGLITPVALTTVVYCGIFNGLDDCHAIMTLMTVMPMTALMTLMFVVPNFPSLVNQIMTSSHLSTENPHSHHHVHVCFRFTFITPLLFFFVTFPPFPVCFLPKPSCAYYKTQRLKCCDCWNLRRRCPASGWFQSSAGLGAWPACPVRGGTGNPAGWSPSPSASALKRQFLIKASNSSRFYRPHSCNRISPAKLIGTFTHG
jgi:hypothetical protein